MAFGRPTRALKLDVETEVEGGYEEYDASIREANEVYRGRMHNLFCDNCHSHVAYAMNLMKYGRSTNWNMVNLCFMVFFKGKFLGGTKDIYIQFVPFFILVFVIIITHISLKK